MSSKYSGREDGVANFVEVLQRAKDLAKDSSNIKATFSNASGRSRYGLR